MMLALRDTRNLWIFGMIAAIVLIAASAIAANLSSLSNPNIIAYGLIFDLVVFLPLAYYGLVVRRFRIPWITVVPFVIVCAVFARAILPAGQVGALSLLEWIAIPLEIGLVSLIAYKSWSIIHRFRKRDFDAKLDVIESIQAASLELFKHPGVAKIFAYEISILYFGLFSWWKNPRSANGDSRSTQFTCHREPGYNAIFAALLIVMLVETVAVHILISWLISHVLAWLITALTVYGTIWFVGDFQALRLRPIRVTGRHIAVRVGLRLETRIEFDEISRVEKIKEIERPLAKTTVNAALLDQPTVRISLTNPVRTAGFYGLSKQANMLYLSIDEPDQFCDLISSASNVASKSDDDPGSEKSV